MRKFSGFVIVILLMLSMVASVYAQDTDDITDVYTFSTGYRFTVPTDGFLNLELNAPRIVVDRPGEFYMFIDVYDPSALQNFFGVDTATLTITESLDYLVGFINAETPAPEDLINLTTDDGRQALSLTVLTSTENGRIIDLFILVGMSDQKIGLVNARTADEISDAVANVIMDVLGSFDAAPLVIGEVVTLESGAVITVPDIAILDTEQFIPAIVFAEPYIRVEIAGPDVLNQVLGDTRELPLVTALDFLRDISNYDEAYGPGEAVFEDSTFDGRDILVFAATNPTNDLPQVILIVRMSDDSIGAINVMPDLPLDEETLSLMFSIADTFDRPSETSAAPDTAAVPDASPSKLSEVYVYESGASFRYPADFILDEEVDAPFAAVILPQRLVIVPLDPVLLGFTPDMTLDEVFEMSLNNLPLDASDMTPVTVGGRQLFVGVSIQEDRAITSISVPFDNGYVGVVEALSPGPLPDDLFALLLEVAASFNATSFAAGN